MANVHILYDNPADAGTYSGGSWVATLPLAYLKTALPTEVARSTGLAASATTFTADLLGPRPLSMFALIGTNLTNTATLRLRVSNAADLSDPLLDVTIPAFEPNVPWGSMPWGAFPWNGFREDYQPGGPITFYRHSATVFGRYLRIDIADAGNPAGFVQIGRFLAGEAFVPRINMAFRRQPPEILPCASCASSSRPVSSPGFSSAPPQRRAPTISRASPRSWLIRTRCRASPLW